MSSHQYPCWCASLGRMLSSASRLRPAGVVSTPPSAPCLHAAAGTPTHRAHQHGQRTRRSLRAWHPSGRITWRQEEHKGEEGSAGRTRWQTDCSRANQEPRGVAWAFARQLLRAPAAQANLNDLSPRLPHDSMAHGSLAHAAAVWCSAFVLRPPQPAPQHVEVGRWLSVIRQVKLLARCRVVCARAVKHDGEPKEWTRAGQRQAAGVRCMAPHGPPPELLLGVWQMCRRGRLVVCVCARPWHGAPARAIHRNQPGRASFRCVVGEPCGHHRRAWCVAGAAPCVWGGRRGRSGVRVRAR